MNENEFNLRNLAKMLLDNIERIAWRGAPARKKHGWQAHIGKFNIHFSETGITINDNKTCIGLQAKTDDEKEILHELYTAVTNKFIIEEEANQKKIESAMIKKVMKELEK